MPYNNPIKKKHSPLTKIYDKKGKPSGLMIEGSVAHMESMSPNKMDHGSMANYGSPMSNIKELENSSEQASKKLEQRAFGDSTPYGTTQEKTIITAPKQRKLDVGAYEQTYRESAKEVTGKDFGYMSNRGSASDAERTAAGLTTANKQNIISQREQFQRQFGKGAQPNKPFIDATDVNLANARTGKQFEATKAKQQKRAEQRMQSNVLAEQTRQQLEQKPVTITTSGVADASSYTKPETPRASQSTKKKSNRQILGPKSFKNRSDYRKYKKSFK